MSALTADEVLALVPQQRPMRFIDEIVELDEERIVGRYTWTAEDCAGYEPAAVVPPFKMIEMAAQVGSVAWGIYHMTLAGASPEEIRRSVGFFTQVEGVEFLEVARAGDRLACLGCFDDVGYFRGGKLVSRVEIQFDGGPKDGKTVMTGVVAGMWVPKDAA